MIHYRVNDLLHYSAALNPDHLIAHSSKTKTKILCQSEQEMNKTIKCQLNTSQKNIQMQQLKITAENREIQITSGLLLVSDSCVHFTATL